MTLIVLLCNLQHYIHWTDFKYLFCVGLQYLVRGRWNVGSRVSIRTAVLCLLTGHRTRFIGLWERWMAWGSISSPTRGSRIAMTTRPHACLPETKPLYLLDSLNSPPRWIYSSYSAGQYCISSDFLPHVQYVLNSSGTRTRVPLPRALYHWTGRLHAPERS